MKIDPIKKIVKWLKCNRFWSELLWSLFQSRFKKSSEPSPHRAYRNYFVADKDPLIIVTSERPADFQFLSKIMGGGRDAYFFNVLHWSVESFLNARIYLYWYRQHEKQYPRHRVTFLCNTLAEQKYFSLLGLPAIFCNQNAFLDPSIYRIYPGAKKKFDVVYNARLEEFKRHFLLSEIRSVGLLIGLNISSAEVAAEALKRTQRVLPEAQVLNYDKPKPIVDFSTHNFSPAPAERVSEIISACRVGVILSKEEGACYASAEYLLTGLPVVSTVSIGGRDVFFDKEYVTIVADDPREVKRAVCNLIDRKIPAEYIREKTIKKMEDHKDRLLEAFKLIYKNRGLESDPSLWDKIYVNKMLHFGRKFPEEFAANIQR